VDSVSAGFGAGGGGGAKVLSSSTIIPVAL